MKLKLLAVAILLPVTVFAFGGSRGKNYPIKSDTSTGRPLWKGQAWPTSPTTPLKPRGAYVMGNYSTGDVVSYQGQSWLAAMKHSNQTPQAGAYWVMLADKGGTGATGPQGATGPAGVQGPQGADGPQGSVGAKGDKGDTGSVTSAAAITIPAGNSPQYVTVLPPSYSNYSGTTFRAYTSNATHQYIDARNGTLYVNGVPASAAGTWGTITGTLSDQTDLNTAFAGKQATITAADTLPISGTASNYVAVSPTVWGHMVGLANRFQTILDQLAVMGYDLIAPVLARIAPASTSPTTTADSLFINYSSSDASGIASVAYVFNGGSSTPLTHAGGHYSATITGATPNAANPIVVTATDASAQANITAESVWWTYQTPVASASPSSKAFADTNTGASSAAQTFTVTNTGLANLTLSPGLSVTGADAGQFALSKGTCVDGATLFPSDTCTASMTFSPTTAGNKTASLLVDSNAADTTASLSGTGTVVVTVPVMSYFNADSATSGQALSKGTGNVTVGAQVASATGQVGNGLKENSLASSDNFYFPALSNIDQAVGTVGMWVKSDQAPTGNAFLFRTTTSSPYFALRYNTANSRWYFQYRTSGGTLDLPANSFPVGTWVFAEIAWNASGNQIACRINGGSWVTATNPTASTPTGANVTFLGDINFQSYMTVDQIMISGTYQADLYSVRNQTSFP